MNSLAAFRGAQSFRSKSLWSGLGSPQNAFDTKTRAIRQNGNGFNAYDPLRALAEGGFMLTENSPVPIRSFNNRNSRVQPQTSAIVQTHRRRDPTWRWLRRQEVKSSARRSDTSGKSNRDRRCS